MGRRETWWALRTNRAVPHQAEATLAYDLESREARAAAWLAERAAQVVNQRALFGPSVATSCDPVEQMSIRELATLTRSACLRVDPACADPVWRAPANERSMVWLKRASGPSTLT